MLVLKRKEREVIRIGDNIKIMVVAICEDGRRVVRLGIDAPDDVPVHREEVYQAIQRKNQEQAKSAP